MQLINLDNAALSTLDKEILSQIETYKQDIYLNPFSLHQGGRNAKQIIDKALSKIAKTINCKKEEIIFSSGGTESNNLAIFGVVNAFPEKKHIITTKIEHKSILEPLKQLEKKGYKIDYLDIDKNGQINLKELEEKITKDTALISIIFANNETGSIQKIKKISEIAKKHNVIFHSDACQTLNYIKIDVKDLGVDLLTINSSKIHGPRSIGLLFKKTNTKINAMIFGGKQNLGLRAGTLTAANTYGFSLAIEKAQKDINKNYQKTQKLRDQLEREILKNIKNSKKNLNSLERLPNITNISFPKINGKELLFYLDMQNILVSTGAACESENKKSSYVLKALNIPEQQANNSIRFSLSKYTKKEEIDYTISSLIKIFSKLNK